MISTESSMLSSLLMISCRIFSIACFMGLTTSEAMAGHKSDFLFFFPLPRFPDCSRRFPKRLFVFVIANTEYAGGGVAEDGKVCRLRQCPSCCHHAESKPVTRSTELSFRPTPSLWRIILSWDPRARLLQNQFSFSNLAALRSRFWHHCHFCLFLVM